MEWINPHSWIHLDVKNPDGTVSRWMIEGGTPNTLIRRGFTKDSLKEGTEITVEGFRAKNGAPRQRRDFILPDGRRLFLGSAGPARPRTAVLRWRSNSRRSRRFSGLLVDCPSRTTIGRSAVAAAKLRSKARSG